MTPSEETVIIYTFRDMASGEFWIDITTNGEPYGSLGPFETEGERQHVHDDLMSMMRSLGARDLPVTPQ